MENSIGRNVQQAVSYIPTATSEALAHGGRSATANAAAAIATHTPLSKFVKCANLFMRQCPETALPMLRAYKNEMANQHAFAQLYQVLETGDLSKLPTANALQVNLNRLSDSDTTFDKGLVYDALTTLTSSTPNFDERPEVNPAVLIRLAEISQVLLEALDFSTKLPNPRLQLKLKHLHQLNRLFDSAGITALEHFTPTRNLITAKFTELTQAIDQVRRNGNFLIALNIESRNNHEIVTAAVQQNGQALVVASEALRNDPEIATAAYQRTPDAIRCIGGSLINNTEFVISLLESNPEGFKYLPQQIQRKQGIATLGFRSPAQGSNLGAAIDERNIFNRASVLNAIFDLEQSDSDVVNNPPPMNPRFQLQRNEGNIFNNPPPPPLG